MQRSKLFAKSEEIILLVCLCIPVHDCEIVEIIETTTALKRLIVVDVFIAKLIPLHIRLWFRGLFRRHVVV